MLYLEDLIELSKIVLYILYNSTLFFIIFVQVQCQWILKLQIIY